MVCSIFSRAMVMLVMKNDFPSRKSILGRLLMSILDTNAVNTEFSKCRHFGEFWATFSKIGVWWGYMGSVKKKTFFSAISSETFMRVLKFLAWSDKPFWRSSSGRSPMVFGKIFLIVQFWYPQVQILIHVWEKMNSPRLPLDWPDFGGESQSVEQHSVEVSKKPDF